MEKEPGFNGTFVFSRNIRELTYYDTTECISPLQRPHYFTSSYTYLFSKKVILLSFLG